jgi:hypothetical protein
MARPSNTLALATGQYRACGQYSVRLSGSGLGHRLQFRLWQACHFQAEGNVHIMR